MAACSFACSWSLCKWWSTVDYPIEKHAIRNFFVDQRVNSVHLEWPPLLVSLRFNYYLRECLPITDYSSDMAARPGTVQRANGIPREKICQFKLVLLGEFVYNAHWPYSTCTYSMFSSNCWILSGVYFLNNAHHSILVTGESAVGKSSLVLRFVKGQFHEYQESTIGGMLVSMTTVAMLKDKQLSWHWEDPGTLALKKCVYMMYILHVTETDRYVYFRYLVFSLHTYW